MAFDKNSHKRLLENLSRCESKAVSKEKEKPLGGVNGSLRKIPELKDLVVARGGDRSIHKRGVCLQKDRLLSLC